MTFCPNCGKQLSPEEGAGKFCPYCGGAFASQVTNQEIPTPPPVYEQPTYADNMNYAYAPVQPEKKKVNPALIIAPVVAIALVVVLLVSGVFGGGYKKPLNDTIKLINKKEADAMEYMYALTPDYVDDVYKAMLKADTYKEMMEESDLEDMYDELDDEFDSWKISFKADKSEKLDKDDIEDYQEDFEEAAEYYEDYMDDIEDTLDDDDELDDMADEMDVSKREAKEIAKAMLDYYKTLSKAKITDIREIKGRFVVKADGDKWESEKATITMVKINGSWAYAGMEDSIEFDDDDEELDYFYELLGVFENSYVTMMGFYF